jgi:hypothetical protein
MTAPVIYRNFGARLGQVKISAQKRSSTELLYTPGCGYILDLSDLEPHSHFLFHFSIIPKGDRVLIIPIIMRGASGYGITGSYWNGIGSVVIGTARKQQDRLFELRSWNSGLTFSTTIQGHGI